MASSNLARLFLVKLAEVLDTRTDELSLGQCKDYSSYREEVGYLRGLRDAIKIIDELEREPDERSDSA